MSATATALDHGTCDRMPAVIEQSPPRAVESPMAVDGRADAWSRLQEHLARVCADAAAVPITSFEETTPAEVDGLIARSRDLLRSALEALDMVAVLYGDSEMEETSSDESVDAGERARWAPPSGCEGVAGTVVLARMGLRARLKLLATLGPTSNETKKIASAGGVLRTIQKALSAVDHAVAEAEQVPASIHFYQSNVQRSLGIRRRYVQLQRLLIGDGPPRPEELRGRLRSVGNAAARLLGLPIADDLRTGDRALLMKARASVQEWLLHQEDDANHLVAGARLWQDLSNVATMFLDVNKREELVQHDARIVAEVLHELPISASLWDGAANAALRARLAPMRGRSPGLDALMGADVPVADLEEVRSVLTGLRRALGAGDVEGDDAPPSGPRKMVRRESA